MVTVEKPSLMNGNETSKEQVILDLRDRISKILSIPSSDLDKSENFWDLFPEGYRYEPRQVTEFVGYISNNYKVYLSERQWEAPTLPKLADHILERQANPQHMLAQIRKDRADRNKGLRLSLIAFPIIFAVCGVGLFLLGLHPLRSGAAFSFV